LPVTEEELGAKQLKAIQSILSSPYELRINWGQPCFINTDWIRANPIISRLLDLTMNYEFKFPPHPTETYFPLLVRL
jgi:hypothetical protein